MDALNQRESPPAITVRDDPLERATITAAVELHPTIAAALEIAACVVPSIGVMDRVLERHVVRFSRIRSHVEAVLLLMVEDRPFDSEIVLALDADDVGELRRFHVADDRVLRSRATPSVSEEWVRVVGDSESIEDDPRRASAAAEIRC